MRRGFFDKLLLDKAAECSPDRAAALATRMVPRALGDAPIHSSTSWSLDENDWEAARRELIALASCTK
jgi:hypothetical protein